MDPASATGAEEKANQIEVMAEFLEHLAQQVANQEQRKRCLDEAGRLHKMADLLLKRRASRTKQNPSPLS